METQLNDLVALLRREISLHEALFALLEEEAARDGALSGAELLSLQQRKNSQVKAITALEEQRLALVGQVAKSWSQPKEELTLLAIASRSAPETAQALQDCHATLLGLVEQIKAKAQETSQNAAGRLKAVNATLDVVREAMKVHRTYSDKGQLTQRLPKMKHVEA